MENNDIKRDQVEYLLKWMQENRAQNTGFGAPIVMLKSILRGDPIEGFCGMITKAEEIDDFEVRFPKHPDQSIGEYLDFKEGFL